MIIVFPLLHRLFNPSSTDFLSTMAREGSRKKKRKYYGNRYSNLSKKACVEEDCNSDGQPCAFGKSVGNLSALARKTGQFRGFDTCSHSTKEGVPKVTGYRFIDMELLAEL